MLSGMNAGRAVIGENEKDNPNIALQREQELIWNQKLCVSVCVCNERHNTQTRAWSSSVAHKFSMETPSTERDTAHRRRN